MCGIIGMISNGKSVSREVVQGLVALQHRGRDSSGIITTNWNGSEFGSIIRGVGPAKEVFKDVNLDEITRLTHGFVGADLHSLCKEAAMVVLRKLLPELRFQKDKIEKR